MANNQTNSQADSLSELKAARLAALREYIRLDAEIRGANEHFPPQGEWASHQYHCKCGEAFMSFADRTLHVLEFDDYVNHHPAENPPRRVQCHACRAVFIHSIPANHADNCRPVPISLTRTENVGGFRRDRDQRNVTTTIDFGDGE